MNTDRRGWVERPGETVAQAIAVLLLFPLWAPAAEVSVFREAAGRGLAWTAPATNTDGTALDDLAGYRVWWGESAESLTNSFGVGLETAVDLPAEIPPNRTWWFAVTAVDLVGNASEPSDAVALKIDTVAPGRVASVRVTGGGVVVVVINRE